MQYLKKDLWSRFTHRFYVEWVNDTLISYDLPTPHAHAWESCKDIFPENKSGTSFDYGFQDENESFEFYCNIDGNTLSQISFKNPKPFFKIGEAKL